MIWNKILNFIKIINLHFYSIFKGKFYHLYSYYYKIMLPSGFEPESKPREGLMIGRTTLREQKSTNPLKILLQLLTPDYY